MAGKDSTAGERSRQQGALPTSDDAGRVEKSTSEDRTLSLDHLDRTHGYDDSHYSWREVAKACDSSEGGSHE